SIPSSFGKLLHHDKRFNQRVGAQLFQSRLHSGSFFILCWRSYLTPTRAHVSIPSSFGKLLHRGNHDHQVHRPDVSIPSSFGKLLPPEVPCSFLALTPLFQSRLHSGSFFISCASIASPSPTRVSIPSSFGKLLHL